MIDNFEMMIQAAVAGIGVALAPDYFVRREIDERRLRSLLKPAIAGSVGYDLARPPEKDRYAPLVAFRAWLGAVRSKASRTPDVPSSQNSLAFDNDPVDFRK